MAGKPSGAAPPHPRPGGRRWHRLGLGLLGSSGSDTAPSTPPLPPPAGFRDPGRLEFQSVSRQGRCREGANPEAKKGVARPVGAAGFRGLCGARSFPGLREPAGREWEGRGSHCCDAAASAGKRRVPGTAPAAGRGLPRPTGPQRSGGAESRREAAEPERGVARARLGETGPSAPSRPRGPGQSGVLPRHLETSKLPRGGSSPLMPPRKFARAGEGALTSSGAAGRSSASGSSSSMRSASAQAATAGPGLGCSPMPPRGPGPAGGCGARPGAPG